jgi:MFS family permease
MVLLAMPLAPYSGNQQSGLMAKGQTVPEALQEALRYRSFLLLVMGFFVCGFHVAFITAHMPAFLSDAGFEAKVGAWSISIIGLCNVFGAYLSGIVSGKISMRIVLVFLYLSRAVVITLFMLIPFSLISVLVFSAFMGFLWLATVPPTSGLVATMFGTRYMAMLYGIVFLGHQVGPSGGQLQRCLAGGLVVRPQRQLRYRMVAGRSPRYNGCRGALAHSGAACGATCRRKYLSFTFNSFLSFLRISHFKQVFVLAFEYQFTVLVMHGRLQCHHTGGTL